MKLHQKLNTFKQKGLLRHPVIYFFLIALMTNSGAFARERMDALIIDTSHYSTTFGEIRNYRIFLPPGYYENLQKRYPVIYFFHGWSQRYFGPVGDDYSNYDEGEDNNGDNIARYVSSHDVIVVKPDGFNPLTDKAYELTPYNECWVTTYRQFPIYFPELVMHIDGAFKTMAERGHRAVCGLSMGGFMSYWVAGKYPDMVSAAGNFCGSTEFMCGPERIPVDYRILDMYRNYGGVNLRYNYGVTDNLRFFHFDLNRVWREVTDNFKFQNYNAAHSTCGLGDMFDFCMHTFENPPAKPEKWDHTDVYPDFSVWGYDISSDRFLPGFTVLENVDKRGFRSAVREFLPDGSTMPFVSLTVTTAPIYEKEQEYIINDMGSLSGTSRRIIRSDKTGRLRIRVNGELHNIGINRTGEGPNPVITSVKIQNMNWAINRKKVEISVVLLNKGQSPAENLKTRLSSVRDYVEVTEGESEYGRINVNETSASAKPFSFYVHLDSVEIARFKLTMSDGKQGEWTEFFELPLRDELPDLQTFEIADGRAFTVSKAAILTETVRLGEGNGDGIANPGESIVILVKDKDKYWRSELYTSDKNVNPFGINNRIKDFWDQFGGIASSPKYSVPLIAATCPENHQIEFAAEYWVPENKFHVIKKGRVRITVAGKDHTAPEVSWVNISGSNRLQVKVCDGGEIAHVSAKLIPVTDVKGLNDVRLKCPDQTVSFDLGDDGKEGDLSASDRVFSKTINPRITYFYRVDVETTDRYGNSAIYSDPGVFLVHRN